jgi:acylphosphatase
MVRRRVTFRGRVQGVYFRDTVRQIAKLYAVSGFVRNVGHDRVELQAEGLPEIVDAFVADVIAHPPPAAAVDGVESAPQQAIGDSGFSVQRTVGR